MDRLIGQITALVVVIVVLGVVAERQRRHGYDSSTTIIW